MAVEGRPKGSNPHSGHPSPTARMAVAGRPKVSNPPSSNPSPQPEPRVSSPQQPFPRRNFGNPESYRSFLCNDPGHRAASCTTVKPRPYSERSPAPPGIPNPVRGNAAIASDHQCSFYEGKAFLKRSCPLPMMESVCRDYFDFTTLPSGVLFRFLLYIVVFWCCETK